MPLHKKVIHIQDFHKHTKLTILAYQSQYLVYWKNLTSRGCPQLNI